MTHHARVQWNRQGWKSLGWAVGLCLGAAVTVLGGGGSGGVDIYPYLGGIPVDGDDVTEDRLPIAVYSQKTFRIVDRDRPGPSLSLAQHHRTDLVLAEPENVPGHSLEVEVKGAQLEVFSSLGRLQLGGRFEITDHDEGDGEDLRLNALQGRDGLLVLVLGERGSHLGSILESFQRVDATFVFPAPRSTVRLAGLRAKLRVLRGLGLDIAIGVLTQSARGIDHSAWCAFSVDDRLAVYDVEIDR